MDKMHRALVGASCFVLAILFLATPVFAQPAQDWRVAGTKTTTFQVSTADVSALSTADIQARANGVTKTARITVDP